MNLLSTILFSFLFTAPTWKTNFNEAKAEAITKHELILLNFSGSDWCIPCMKLKKSIFDSETFTLYASEKLVLVNADFPRQNKHKLSAEQKKINEGLAEKYNPEGKFPYTVLVTADGKIVKQWEGLPDVSADQFVDEIKNMDAAR
jgi:thioredoxin-related protein